MRRLSEIGLFFKEFVTNQYTTGAVLPSGRFLAKALARFVAEKPDGPRRVLEVGPGTGAVTARIVRVLAPEDRLDMVELNERFVKMLEGRFENEEPFRAVAERCRVLHCPVEELEGQEPYHLAVSGLPLNNFPAADVEKILATITGLLLPGGTLSFFEYIAMRRMKGLVSGRAERERLGGVGQAMAAVLSDQEIRRDAVWINVPPAWVHHVRV